MRLWVGEEKVKAMGDTAAELCGAFKACREVWADLSRPRATSGVWEKGTLWDQGRASKRTCTLTQRGETKGEVITQDHTQVVRAEQGHERDWECGTARTWQVRGRGGREER